MLADFIEKTRSDPFEWGRNDCALWCASAVAHETGMDPAADLRGTYASRFECRALIIEAGSLLALVEPLMTQCSMADLNGDGVAVMRLDRKAICGLIIDRRAIVKLDSGLRITDDFEILRGWSCRKR
ncbi:hypothetical protein [uncultured Sulfitobacter sp.]|uniref:DUF6950 family protein n=1 Tax=uncultured Sulfitobacter sp. TaxID=191468 RepID=UPI002592EF2E|nr:hypothetical protein [uncultured Sulfitobacter sp.]